MDDVLDAPYGFVVCARDGNIRDNETAELRRVWLDETRGCNLVKASLGADSGADSIPSLEEEGECFETNQARCAGNLTKVLGHEPLVFIIRGNHFRETLTRTRCPAMVKSESSGAQEVQENR